MGLLKANTYFNPRLNPANSLLRRNMVLKLMEKENYLSAEIADSLQKLPIRLTYENVSSKATAGYFVYQVKGKILQLLEAVKARTGKNYNLEKDGLKIYTTLNMQVQELATKAVKNQLMAMQPLLDKELSHSFKKQWYTKQKRLAKYTDKDFLPRSIEVFEWDGIRTENMSKLDSLWHYYKLLNAAVLITNPKNGAVISWVGGNHFPTLPFDMVLSHRQIASAFKPFLYATALENGFMPCSYLENEANIYPGYEDWEPQNFNHESTPDSTVALWYALAHSMNLPAVDLYFKVGREKLMNTCNRLKFPTISDDAPSIALGTLDLSLSEVVRAYASFANNGKLNELVLITKITDAEGNVLYVNKSATPENVFNPETAWNITAMLQQAINQGTGVKIRSNYGIHADLAGKTGTAQNYSDAWFFAYTPDLVLGTWVGASSPDVHFFSSNGTGASLALPIIANVLQGIEKDAALRNKYLTFFSLADDMNTMLECEPYLQKGVKGFFNRLFKVNDKKDPDSRNKDKNDTLKKGKKSFFERLFKGD